MDTRTDVYNSGNKRFFSTKARLFFFFFLFFEATSHNCVALGSLLLHARLFNYLSVDNIDKRQMSNTTTPYTNGCCSLFNVNRYYDIRSVLSVQYLIFHDQVGY